MSTPVPERLLERWRRAAAEPFQGWDFRRLAGRMLDESPPWSYPELVRRRLAGATSVLDLGTGGGEVLLSMIDAWPARVVATEGWPPNLPLARQALEPLGVHVIDYDSDRCATLPLPDDDLDLVVDRHECFDAEVARVLRPGGVFLTQQVGDRNLCELAALLGPPQIPATVTSAGLSHLLSDAGMIIDEQQDFLGRTTFSDVAALVYYLSAVPFTAPADFAVDRYADQLLAIHRTGPARGELITLTQHRFLIIARNP